MMNVTEKIKKFVSVKQLSKTHPSFSIASLRWTIFNEKFNGASVFIRRVGKKIVIDLDAFEDWVEKGSQK